MQAANVVQIRQKKNVDLQRDEMPRLYVSIYRYIMYTYIDEISITVHTINRTKKIYSIVFEVSARAWTGNKWMHLQSPSPWAPFEDEWTYFWLLLFHDCYFSIYGIIFIFILFFQKNKIVFIFCTFAATFVVELLWNIQPFTPL